MATYVVKSNGMYWARCGSPGIWATARKNAWRLTHSQALALAAFVGTIEPFPVKVVRLVPKRREPAGEGPVCSRCGGRGSVAADVHETWVFKKACPDCRGDR